MNGLLDYSLERITSLQLFYNIFRLNIQEEANRGKEVNRFGFLLDCYFRKRIEEREPSKEDKHYQALEEYILDEIEVIKINDNNGIPSGLTYRIKDRNKLLNAGFELNIDKAKAQYLYYSEMPEIHASSTLVMLITRFEEFVSDVLAELYTMFPKKYLDSQKISFSEIVDLGIDEIRNKIVMREIDEKMRASYTDWFKLFKEHAMNFNSCQKEMDDLCEIYARRNIIIHNSGRVNESYLSMNPNSTLKLDDIAEVDDKYLHFAFITIKCIIYKIIIEAARLLKDEKLEYLIDVFNHGFTELMNENYNVASKVFFELYNSKYIDTEYKYLSQINYWISEIELHGLDKVRSNINEFDTTVFDDMFKLAKLVLLEEYESATVLIFQMLKQERLSSNTIEQWPLFRRYVQSPQYSTLKTDHPEFFTTSSFQVDVTTTENTNEPELICEKDACEAAVTKKEESSHIQLEAAPSL